MILWFKELPARSLTAPQWRPFIHQDWLRTHYMKIVFVWLLLQVTAPLWLSGGYSLAANRDVLVWAMLIFVVHELLHVVVVYTKGDISLTFRNFFFWLNTEAEMSKGRFFLFMSLPFFMLTIVPLAVYYWTSVDWRHLLLFVAWINAIISSSDVVNMLLIAIKPRTAIFCRGYYRVPPS